MNREATSLTLSRASAPPGRTLRERLESLEPEQWVLAGLWLFIGLVSAYDTYLAIKFQEMLRFHELNPMGRWLLEVDNGSVATFMGCKFVGTMLVLGTIQLLYAYERRLGLTVASALAAVQGMLALYLTFG